MYQTDCGSRTLIWFDDWIRNTHQRSCQVVWRVSTLNSLHFLLRRTWACSAPITDTCQSSNQFHKDLDINLAQEVTTTPTSFASAKKHAQTPPGCTPIVPGNHELVIMENQRHAAYGVANTLAGFISSHFNSYQVIQFGRQILADWLIPLEKKCKKCGIDRWVQKDKLQVLRDERM